MKGFIYRLGAAVKDTRLFSGLVIRLGLAMRGLA
jgi:hypothetical protein